MLTVEDFRRVGWGNVEELDDQVFLVRDVLSGSECQDLISELSTYNEEQWRVEYEDAMKSFALREHGRPLQELIDEGLLSLDPAWMDKNILLSEGNPVLQRLNGTVTDLINFQPSLRFREVLSAQRQYTGVELKLHTDGDSDSALRYALVFYLNEDFTGGELYFPTRSLEVKPAAGSVIFFPTTNEYKHGVRPVTGGATRYVLPSFIEAIN